MMKRGRTPRQGSFLRRRLTKAQRAEIRDINFRLERLRAIACVLIARREYIKRKEAPARDARRRVVCGAPLPPPPAGVWRGGDPRIGQWCRV